MANTTNSTIPNLATAKATLTNLTDQVIAAILNHEGLRHDVNEVAESLRWVGVSAMVVVLGRVLIDLAPYIAPVAFAAFALIQLGKNICALLPSVKVLGIFRYAWIVVIVLAVYAVYTVYAMGYSWILVLILVIYTFLCAWGSVVKLI
ncbi:Uu.00g042780.m01.CDS01 [Anthostomella pinea]|uniref:Uu.00g042780.m01.CDS01 n=1 Tax=Anthostomella pinea TaxID=933095 RepID=A0AAI8VAM9_9PEZI|nr:Uu.00g042780.m01.CDS01 [Anthostomella pinea]